MRNTDDWCRGIADHNKLLYFCQVTTSVFSDPGTFDYSSTLTCTFNCILGHANSNVYTFTFVEGGHDRHRQIITDRSLYTFDHRTIIIANVNVLVSDCGITTLIHSCDGPLNIILTLTASWNDIVEMHYRYF